MAGARGSYGRVLVVHNSQIKHCRPQRPHGRYEQAAAAGVVAGTAALAELCERGAPPGVERDAVRAAALYRAAAGEGHARATARLAACHLTGTVRPYTAMKKLRIVILVYPRVWHGAPENGP
jgi:hypothetical protein